MRIHWSIGVVANVTLAWNALAAGPEAPDWYDDTKRPGVPGCEEAIYNYDPNLHYVPGTQPWPMSVSAATVQDNAFVTRLTEAIGAAAAWKIANNRERTFNVLALSGGGQWGAYGAGFLNGWAEADTRAQQPSGHVRREDIDLVTGISTGAMQLAFAYLGSSSDPSVRVQAGLDLEGEYLDPDIAKLVRFRGYAAVLTDNSLYSVDKLARRVQARVAHDFPRYRAMPSRQRLYSGAVNLDDGQFAIADLKFLADAPDNAMSAKTQRSCFASSVLASAAVPLGFPPRFVGGKMFVDGGARFGLFSSIVLTNPHIRDALRANQLALRVFVIINGNQSASSYADAAHKPVKDGFFAIADATMSNVLDQLYKDAAYRNEADLQREYADAYASSYTYVSNDDIRSAQFEPCQGFRDKPAADQFDPKFMRCLYEIGRSRWPEQSAGKSPWKCFRNIPVQSNGEGQKPSRTPAPHEKPKGSSDGLMKNGPLLTPDPCRRETPGEVRG